MTNAALLLLADSRFPTGAHAHSNGVEAAHARGDLLSLADLSDFIDGRLATVGTTEAAFAAAACMPGAVWVDLDRELAARTPSPRLRAVSRTLSAAGASSRKRAVSATVGGRRPRALGSPAAPGGCAFSTGLKNPTKQASAQATEPAH